MLEFEIYSPEEELKDPLFKEKGVRVYVKRDDMIHPFISGNKWRKLKHTLEKARAEDKKLLVTFGGAYSNHLLATACAGAKFGFQTIGFVRGEEVNNPTLMLCKLFGMELRFIDRERYRNKKEVFVTNFQQDTSAMFIDEGGAGEDAVEGCSELVGELKQNYDHIFCAAGTGTTAAGILRGVQQRGMDTRVHVVPVLKNAGFIGEEIAGYVKTVQMQLHLDYHFGGYAKTTPELLDFVSSFAAGTGILLDQVYTGKMFFSAYDLLKRNHFPQGSSILLIHTGGLLGLMGQAEKIHQFFSTKKFEQSTR